MEGTHRIVQRLLQPRLRLNPVSSLLTKSVVPNHLGHGRRWKTSAQPTLSTHFVEIPHKHIFPAKYGGRTTVTLLPGGGIGPELTSYVQDIFVTDGVRVDFEFVDIDIDVGEDIEEDQALKNAIVSIKRNGAALKGNIETRSFDPNIVSRNVALRNELDLFVNVLHMVSFPGVSARYQGINAVIIRQNTEGEYALLEHEAIEGVVSCLKIMTRPSVTKLAKFAFEYARRNKRKKVTVIHKANIMKLSDGLFLDCCKTISKDYPDIAYNEMIVDNCCMQLVSDPKQFDVMLTTNLYGNIVSNVLCGLMGGAGLYSGRNYGDNYAVFEPGARNTGTKIAGKGIANPVSMINASIDLLKHIGNHFSAHRIQNALLYTINEAKIHTKDLGGHAKSQDVVNCIKEYLRIHPKA